MRNYLHQLTLVSTLVTGLGLFPAKGVEVVYVTSNVSNCTATAVCGSGANTDVNINGEPVYQEIGGAYTSALASTPDKPLNAGGARYYSATFTNAAATLEGITLRPTLGVTGGVYKVYHVFSSAANNVTLDGIIGITNNSGCTLSFSETDRFQRSYGQPAPQQWQFLGYLTNNPDTSTPTITLYYKSGIVTATGGNRLVVDTFRFTYYEPCTDIPGVGVTGPLATNLATVVVTGVSNAASKITVYQDSGSGMVQVGSLSSGIVGGNNNVPVTGLVKGAQVAATQTLNGQDGCVPASGVLIGGGANPSIRIALTIRETTNTTATIGAPGNTTGANYHFLGATTVSGGAPVDAPIFYPSNDWQTVSFTLGRATIDNVANAAGAVSSTGVYNANDSVVIRVHAYRIVPETGAQIFSRAGAESPAVTSNSGFGVNWSWASVTNAEGYRLLRNVNGAGFLDYVDVTGTNFYEDATFAWFGGDVVTPNSAQLGSSIQWNPSVGNPNNIAGQWGTLESINFAIDDLTDTGPFDIYIDNIQNGSTVFQTFEEAVANRTDYGFRAPSFSGTTSANLLTAPNAAQVSNAAADSGSKSLRIRFQWNNLTSTKWLRLTTSGASPASNPFLNLDEPISFRMLLLPVGSTPVQPPAPSLAISQLGLEAVLDWVGAHNLQAAPEAMGTYTNVPNVTLAPYTNAIIGGQKFFRLAN